MSNWNQITDQNDVDHLTRTFGTFHDSCLREAQIWTGHSVGTDLAMKVPSGRDVNLRMFFQRQFQAPSAIEIEFLELAHLQLTPTGEAYDSVIYAATITITDSGDFRLDVDMESDSSLAGLHSEIVVIARTLKWRPVDWMGDELIYGESSRRS